MVFWFTFLLAKKDRIWVTVLAFLGVVLIDFVTGLCNLCKRLNWPEKKRVCWDLPIIIIKKQRGIGKNLLNHWWFLFLDLKFCYWNSRSAGWLCCNICRMFWSVMVLEYGGLFVLFRCYTVGELMFIILFVNDEQVLKMRVTRRFLLTCCSGRWTILRPQITC